MTSPSPRPGLADRPPPSRSPAPSPARLQRRIGLTLALGGFLFVAWATLIPTSDPNGLTLLTPIWCLVCGDHGGADIAANLLLFLPFAAGLRLTGVSWRRTVLVSAAISFTVESLQLVVIPGRDASLSDLLTNTASAAIGATLARHLPEAVHPSRERARRLLAIGGIVWLGTLGLAAWLLMPSMPEGVLMSRWAHRAPGLDVFGGGVEVVRLDGLSMPADGSPPDSARLRHQTDLGEFSLEAEVTSGPPTHDPSWIYMFRVPSGGALTLYQLRREAGIAVPVRALRYLARPVTVTLNDGFPAAAGVPVRFEVTGRGGLIRLSSTYGDSTRTVTLGLSPAYGWRLFSPFELGAGTEVRRFTALCIALSVLPLAYWATRGGGAAFGICAATVALGLGGLPWLAGLPPVHRSEWIAAALGIGAGWALQQCAAYLQSRCASPSASEFSSS